jgi:hypothetical protein
MNKQRKDTRLLIAKGQPWEFKIGRRFVAIYGPEKQRFYVENKDIEGAGIEKRYNGPLDSATAFYKIGPAAVRDHIERKILGEEVTSHKKCVRCKTVKANVYLRCNPFAAEIHEDYTKFNYCNECVADLADDI